MLSDYPVLRAGEGEEDTWLRHQGKPGGRRRQPENAPRPSGPAPSAGAQPLGQEAVRVSSRLLPRVSAEAKNGRLVHPLRHAVRRIPTLRRLRRALLGPDARALLRATQGGALRGLRGAVKRLLALRRLHAPQGQSPGAALSAAWPPLGAGYCAPRGHGCPPRSAHTLSRRRSAHT
jgi:hypothetical protein